MSSFKTFNNIIIAESLIQRSLGVIGRKSFGNSNGMLIKNTNSIHTFFVFFPLDLVFLSGDMEILHLTEGLKPFSISPIIWKAKHVLELPAGTIKKNNLKLGERISINK